MFKNISRELKFLANFGVVISSIVNIFYTIGLYDTIGEEYNIDGGARVFVLFLCLFVFFIISYGFCGILYGISVIIDHLQEIANNTRKMANNKTDNNFKVVYSTNENVDANNNANANINTNNTTANVNQMPNAASSQPNNTNINANTNNASVTIVPVNDGVEEIICPICKKKNRLRENAKNKCYYCGSLLK